ncbi:MAG: hypothetical protein HQM08_14295 [Candidatus Riflebacteria bacterium]|nr:hypothetical protein [Candidatus Riflebacteria bacterium]
MEEHIFSVDTIPLIADHAIEGTPFVPFALLVEELLRSEEPLNSSFVALKNVELVQPAMLRRNRPKTYFHRQTPYVKGLNKSHTSETDFKATCNAAQPLESLSEPARGAIKSVESASESEISPVSFSTTRLSEPAKNSGNQSSIEVCVELLDASEKPIIKGLHSQNCELPMLYSPEQNNARELLLLSREELYPDLFFHGPTLQADFAIRKGDADSLLVKLSGLAKMPSSPKQLSEQARQAIIPADLALQIAVLHGMCFSQVPLLPWGCLSYFRNQNTLNFDSVLVSAHKVANCTYDIDVLIDPLPKNAFSGESLLWERSTVLSWRKVTFRSLQHVFSDRALSLLSKIKNSLAL